MVFLCRPLTIVGMIAAATLLASSASAMCLAELDKATVEARVQALIPVGTRQRMSEQRCRKACEKQTTCYSECYLFFEELECGPETCFTGKACQSTCN